MAKRFFISLLLVAVVVAAVAAGAAYLFRGSYESLAALQAQAEAQKEAAAGQELPPVLDAAVPAEDQPEFGLSDDEIQAEAPAATVQPEDFTNTLRAKAIVNDMTLTEKICQMLFVTPEALTGYSRVTQSGSVTRSALNRYPVGGVIYFDENLITMNQTTSMLEDIQAFAQEDLGIGLFLGVDEEGGEVARVAENLGTTTFENMSVYGAEGDPQKAYEIGFTIATDIRSLGFNVDFAPVADVLSNEQNTVVKERSFGSDPDKVAEMVTQEVRGFVDGSVLCAPKHFPGHGSTGEDTHDGFAASDRSIKELEESDFKPFQAAIQAGAPMIMVGHMTMTAVDSENPASLSKAVVTGLLRERLGYDGVVITDAMNMSAITDQYTYPDAALKAIDAGCDMLLCVSNVSGVIDAVEAAVQEGEISENRINDSVIRILTAKLKYGLAA